MSTNKVQVIKRNFDGEEIWRYPAEVLFQDTNSIVVSARFNRQDLFFNGVLLKHGDQFFEAYFDDRWYNIFEIHDRDEGLLKGWYCNVTYPATIKEGEVSYVDLALDLLVFPDGRQVVLDEDEYAALPLNPQAQQRAIAALARLQVLFSPPIKFRLDKGLADFYLQDRG